MSDDDRIYLLIKTLPLNYKMKLSNFLALIESKSQNYEEIKASLINIFEREHAWNLISQNFRLSPITLSRDKEKTQEVLEKPQKE